ESKRCIRETRGVLLDRWLDQAELTLAPFAVCDVRRGVRVEFSGSEEPHVYCILHGEGALRATQGFAAAISTCTVAIVPAGVPHLFEPCGGSSRMISLRPVHASARLPAVIAGDGEPGLLLICARLRDNGACEEPVLQLQTPLAVDLLELPWAVQAFDALR